MFITIEGIEGAGKSTQAGRLVRAIAATGRRVVATREPGGGGRVGETLRTLLRDPEIWSTLELSEIFLYAAARAQHVEALIAPALAAGAVVVCDRYLDSTLAYQGYGRGRPIELIEALHRLPPLTLRPDRTVWLDLSPREGLARAHTRAAEQHRGYDDADEAFFTKVQHGFQAIAAADPQRVRTIDAAAGPDQVHQRIVDALADCVPGLAPLAAS